MRSGEINQKCEGKKTKEKRFPDCDWILLIPLFSIKLYRKLRKTNNYNKCEKGIDRYNPRERERWRERERGERKIMHAVVCN